MAEFVININPEPVIPYSPQALKIQRDACTSPLTETIPLGIVETTNTPGIEWIFKDYTGVGWSTLRIYDLEYSDEATFYLEHAASKVLPNVDPNVAVATIDVTTVNANESVPTLQLELDATPLTQNEFIKFTVEIEDTATNLGGKVDVYFYLLALECPSTTPAVKIGIVSETDIGCYIEKVVSVKVPPESSRYVYGVIFNSSGSYGTINGTTLPGETITVSKQYTLKIDASLPGGSSTVYSTVAIYVKDSITSGTILDSEGITRSHAGDVC